MIQDLIARGLEQHRAGRLHEAQLLYEQVLRLDSRHPDAQHLLGVVALQRGDPASAVTLIEKAIQAQPANPGFHANLAQAWLATRHVTDALAAFRNAARLDPHNPQYVVGVASCMARLGQAAEAEERLRRLTQDYPGYALAWFNLGNAVRDQGRQREALDLYSHAIELEPALAEAHGGIGQALHALARFEEAEAAYRRSLVLQPESETGHRNLASLLIDCGRFADAARVCEQALALAPTSVELHLMLGNALAEQGRLTAALAVFRSAMNLAPDNPHVLWAYGFALRGTGATARGMECLERVLELQPDTPEFRHASAGAYLALGDLRAGWKEYEWRTARRIFLADNPHLRLAAGLPANLSGSKICLLREQGLGDELFFLRFAGELKSRGAEITYLAHAKLASLLERVPALVRVITRQDALPAADSMVLVGDLPRMLARFACSPLRPRTDSRQRPPGALTKEIASVRRQRIFYPELPPPLALTVSPPRLQDMTRRLDRLGPPPYIGMTWRAGIAPAQQRETVWLLHKALPLGELGAALREVDGTLLALQRNPGSGEIGRLASLAGRPVHDLAALNEDLEAMLALLSLLNEYIGVSNTNMHLRAGAGRTARVLVPCPPEWRWMATGDESPWFPGFRVYRQGPDGDWGGALARLTRELVAECGKR